MTAREGGAVKLSDAQDAALQFLASHDEGYPGMPFWFREPNYCWSRFYGDFHPQSLHALVRKGLAYHEKGTLFGITPAGRLALKQSRGDQP